MNAEQIRAIAHRTAIEILGERLNLEQAEHYETFATRFLTALTEQAEPVATVWDSQCINVLLPDGTNLFLHPPFEQRNAHPEPAPRQMPLGDTEGTATSGVGAARIFGIIPAEETDDEFTRQVAEFESAAPLPDDVARMVENLRSRHRLMYKASPIPSVMTQYTELRKAAERATGKNWEYIEFGNRHHVDTGSGCITSPVYKRDAKFIAQANPATIIALLDEREKLLSGLQNCRLLAARHRKEDWALLILGFCAEGGVVGSITR